MLTATMPMPNMAALIAGANTNIVAPKRKKGETPKIFDEALKDETDMYLGLCDAFNAAEARKKGCQAVIMRAAEPRRIELARRYGEALSSVRINGLLYVFSKPHYTTALKSERIPEVQGLFGPDFDRYFAPKFEVEANLETIAAMHAANIPYTVKYVPTEALHVDRTLNEETAAKCEQLPDVAPIAYVRA